MSRSRRAFPSGEKVTYTGAEVVCSSCVAAPQRQTARARSPLAASPPPERASANHTPHSPHSPHSPQSPHSPHSPHSPDADRDVVDDRPLDQNGECYEFFQFRFFC